MGRICVKRKLNETPHVGASNHDDHCRKKVCLSQDLVNSIRNFEDLIEKSMDRKCVKRKLNETPHVGASNQDDHCPKKVCLSQDFVNSIGNFQIEHIPNDNITNNIELPPRLHDIFAYESNTDSETDVDVFECAFVAPLEDIHTSSYLQFTPCITGVCSASAGLNIIDSEKIIMEFQAFMNTKGGVDVEIRLLKGILVPSNVC